MRCAACSPRDETFAPGAATGGAVTMVHQTCIKHGFAAICIPLFDHFCNFKQHNDCSKTCIELAQSVWACPASGIYLLNFIVALHKECYSSYACAAHKLVYSRFKRLAKPGLSLDYFQGGGTTGVCAVYAELPTPRSSGPDWHFTGINKNKII